MKTTVCALALLLVAVPAPAQNSEHAGVHQAALDYVTAFYESRLELIERSVSRDLTKHGFKRQKDGSFRRSPMTYQRLLDEAREWNQDKKQDVSIKDVKVGEVLDHTATATVRASWGIDFMQLAKIDGRWLILNILWQSHPPTTK